MMSLDPDLPVRQLQPAAALIGRARNYQSIIGSLLSLMAALGLTGEFGSSVPVLAGVTAVLLAIAQIACYLPARSASRIPPAEALRAE
jgi:ABC-type antimicrobial peptide transport system permease subunit